MLIYMLLLILIFIAAYQVDSFFHKDRCVKINSFKKYFQLCEVKAERNRKVKDVTILYSVIKHCYCITNCIADRNKNRLNSIYCALKCKH